MASDNQRLTSVSGIKEEPSDNVKAVLIEVIPLLEIVRDYEPGEPDGACPPNRAMALIEAIHVILSEHSNATGAPPVTQESAYSVHYGDCPYEHGGACTCSKPLPPNRPATNVEIELAAKLIENQDEIYALRSRLAILTEALKVISDNEKYWHSDTMAETARAALTQSETPASQEKLVEERLEEIAEKAADDFYEAQRHYIFGMRTLPVTELQAVILSALREASSLPEQGISADAASVARRDTGCPFCHLLHDYEKTDCHGHDGKRLIYIRQKGPITDEEKSKLL